VLPRPCFPATAIPQLAAELPARGDRFGVRSQRSEWVRTAAGWHWVMAEDRLPPAVGAGAAMVGCRFLREDCAVDEAMAVHVDGHKVGTVALPAGAVEVVMPWCGPRCPWVLGAMGEIAFSLAAHADRGDTGRVSATVECDIVCSRALGAALARVHFPVAFAAPGAGFIVVHGARLWQTRADPTTRQPTGRHAARSRA
jgi:hypothetical protein